MRNTLKAFVGAVFDTLRTITSFVGWALLSLTGATFCLAGVATLAISAVFGAAGGIGWAWLWVWMKAEEGCIASMKRADKANVTRFTQTVGRWLACGIGYGTLTIPFVVWVILAVVCALVALIVLALIFCLGVAIIILTAGTQRMLSTLNTRLTGAPPVSPILAALIEQVKTSVADAANKKTQ